MLKQNWVAREASRAAHQMHRSVLRAIVWVGSHELAVLLALLVIVAGVWGFVALADKVLEGKTQRLDEAVVRALRSADDPSLPLGPRWLAEAGRDITALGGVAVLVLMTAGVAGYLLLNGKTGTTWFVLIATLGGMGIGWLLKAVFQRPRPMAVPHSSYVFTSSFPSGHSLMSAVVYLTLGVLLARSVAQRRSKFYFLFLAVLLTGLVGASRVYLGVHYPTDVLAGWTAGLVWATLCWLIARLLQRRGAIEKEG